MEIEKMTRDTLRNMLPGRTYIYTLPTARQCESARVMCSNMKTYEGMEFTTAIDAQNRTISITRLK